MPRLRQAIASADEMCGQRGGRCARVGGGEDGQRTVLMSTDSKLDFVRSEHDAWILT